MCNRPRTASIHTLDDDSLLHVFYLSRPFLLEDGYTVAEWRYSGYWWYTPAHVCQRWRNIILGSASYLDLSLVCTYGTPVADMLAHSPPLPLVLGYFTDRGKLTTEDEEGIILALKERNRVRRVRFGNAVQKLFVAMDEEYPILEYLYITRPKEDNSTILQFPETLRAPHLRYLSLGGFAFPIGSRLLTTAMGLVTLHLVMIHPSTYFHPNTLIQWISLMPHLETLKIYFTSSIPNRDVVRQLTHAPNIAPITLPNLHYINFRGVSSYLEALVHRITTPHLEKLRINFFNQLSFSVPRLLQFIDTAESLRFNNAELIFSDKFVDAGAYSPGQTGMFPFVIRVFCCHLDWQVSSATQISKSSQMFSAVERLVLRYKVHSESSEEHNEVDCTEWRKLLRPFSNVKILRVEKGLVKDISRSLELEDGELPLELLPELQELRTFGSGDTGDAFTSFIDARRNAGRPVTVVRG